MIKKAIVLLFTIISLLSFSEIVAADVDHSLSYSIESVEFTDTKIIFKGWASVNNNNNYGTKYLDLEEKNFVVKMYASNKQNLGLSSIEDGTIAKTNQDAYNSNALYYPKCYKSIEKNESGKIIGDGCYESLLGSGIHKKIGDLEYGEASCNSDVPHSSCMNYNTGFTITFAFDEILEKLDAEKNIYFYINAQYKNNYKDKENTIKSDSYVNSEVLAIGVSNEVIKNITDDSTYEGGNLKLKITSSNSFNLSENYAIKRNKDLVKGFDYYHNGERYEYFAVSNYSINKQAFYSRDYYVIQGEKKFYSGNRDNTIEGKYLMYQLANNYWAFAAWGNVVGQFSIKFIYYGDDDGNPEPKICNFIEKDKSGCPTPCEDREECENYSTNECTQTLNASGEIEDSTSEIYKKYYPLGEGCPSSIEYFVYIDTIVFAENHFDLLEGAPIKIHDGGAFTFKIRYIVDFDMYLGEKDEKYNVIYKTDGRANLANGEEINIEAENHIKERIKNAINDNKAIFYVKYKYKKTDGECVDRYNNLTAGDYDYDDETFLKELTSESNAYFNEYVDSFYNQLKGIEKVFDTETNAKSAFEDSNGKGQDNTTGESSAFDDFTCNEVTSNDGGAGANQFTWSCTTKLKNSYINIKTGEVKYGSNISQDNFELRGSKYYTPIGYKGNFTINVDVTGARVQFTNGITSKNRVTDYVYNCNIEVKPKLTVDKEYLPNYRVVDLNKMFPNVLPSGFIEGDTKYGVNWHEWISTKYNGENTKDGVNTKLSSYFADNNKLEYTANLNKTNLGTILDSNKINKDNNEITYSKIEINANGKSALIDDNSIFIRENSPKYSKLGESGKD